jgi:hypothetical protein
MRTALLRWLERPRAATQVVLLSLLLCTPALGTGLVADDYFHALVLRGVRTIEAIPTDPMALFVWASGDPAQAHAMMEVGMTGWWTDPEMVMAYFRPFSVATHHLDYRLWPDTPWLMHLHSLAWFGFGLLLLGRLYASTLSAPLVSFVPVLALLLYGVDDAHGLVVSWVANRNALCALALGALVLLLHDRGRRHGDVRAGRAAKLALAAALLAGESALAVTGYLFAYALFLDPAPRKLALRGLLPYAAVAAAWAIVYRGLGFGARGSGLVVDPGSEPVRYLGLALVRVPVLLAAELGFPPSDPWEAYVAIRPWLPAVMLGVALLQIGVFAWLLLPALRAHAAARFFALGSVLSLLPVASQFPHDRLLTFAGVGAAPVLALALAPLLQAARDGALDAGRLRRAGLWGLFVVHLLIAPLWLPLRVRAPLDLARMIATADESIDDSPAIRDKTVILVNPPADPYAGLLPTLRAAEGRPMPRALRWLATGASEVRVTRVDDRSLRVRPAAGFLSLPSERMQRNPARRMPVGHEVRYSDTTIRVTAITADGRPAEILARFDAPLEDARFVFLAWSPDKRFVPFALPAVGQSRTLPKVDFASLLP